MTEEFLHQTDELDEKIRMIEERIKEVLLPTREVGLLMSLPGVGLILATVMALEIGDVERFPTSEHLASCAGVVPKVHSSGGKSRHKGLRKESNKYLKWAYTEAASVVAVNHKRKPFQHMSQLYKRIKEKKGHHKAVGAVARHLAEASYWVLKKEEKYKDPLLSKKVSKLGA
ncbi:transposase [Thermosulfidibacter takaii]|uniref:transposase n=1 Tax=Thermosulfidibacter takaii TaxID=412593 RepID=UPI000838C362|nr:transposase [Thermosulfidibacter takaii]